MNKILANILENGDDSYYDLTDEEQAVYNLKSIINAVNGAGLLAYYKSVAGGYASDALEALYSVGMDEIAAVIESANSIFPDGYPPEDMSERLEIISELEDDYADLFDEWTDEILEFAPMLENEIRNIISELEGAE